MADYSLVPVDYQPSFDSYALVPVDYDPFAGDGGTQQAQAQPAPTQGQQADAKPTQIQSQSLRQPAPSAQPEPSGGSSSPFVKFLNQLADPERAESEQVVDLVQNHPTAAKIAGTIGLGSVLLPPLAMAGAGALGLLGAGAGESAVASGLAGSAVSGAGRVAASTAARQAISEAEATLPNGITRQEFGRLAGFENSLGNSSRASTEATAEIISRLKAAGITQRSVAAFQNFYENAAREVPSNTSAAHRAALLANILRSFQ
ncbi:DUF4951 domain-containing protein [Bradyrhizobium sp. USDA 4461]